MSLSIITTITTPADSYDLVTLEIVKDDLGISGNSEDAFLERAISRASAAISQFCNRVFVVETIKDEVFPDRDTYPFQVPGGMNVLQLSRWPVVALTSITEGDAVLVEGDDYRLDKARGQVFRLGLSGMPMKWPAKAIVVEYSAGFATIPGDLQDAASRLVKARRASRTRDPNMMSESIPGVRDVRYWVPNGNDQGNIPPDIADAIDNYRVPVVA